jgi:polyferredoxin
VVHGWTRLQMFRRALRPRVLIYGAVLSAASVAFAASVALRSPFQFDVIKDRGTLARIVDDGAVENVYRIQIMNRTEAPQTYRVTVGGIDGLLLQAQEVTVEPAGIESIVARVQLSPEQAQPLRGQSSPIEFEVATQALGSERPAALRERSTFHVPR